jgi:hypothetical protein
MEVSGHLHAAASLPPERETSVPSGPQSRSGRGGEEENLLSVPGTPVVQPVTVTILTELHTLLLLPGRWFSCRILLPENEMRSFVSALLPYCGQGNIRFPRFVY